MRRWIVSSALLILMLKTVAAAAGFDRGTTHFSLLVGNGQAFGDSYIVVGVGAAYFIANGLELGLELESWLNGDPSIYKVTPAVRYVFRTGGNVNPYVGAFYRRVFIEEFADRDAYGGRVGAYFNTGARSYLGVGIAYSELIDCNEQLYVSCSDTYPELSFGFAF